MNTRELKELQQRIEWGRATLHIGEANRKPVAVRVFDDHLFYGEVFEDDPSEDITRFGDAQREFLSSRRVLVEVEAGINPTDLPLTVRMGVTRSQPHEGKAVWVGMQNGAYGWVTTLRIVADENGVLLVAHAHPD